MENHLDESRAAPIDLSGHVLGDYTLLRRLGRGAMADVYLAEQQSLRRPVAIKILKPELATDERYVKRFHVEAQAAAALVHANIVQIHEVGCVNSMHFIAQEYVPGRNLRELLDERGAFEAATAIRVLSQVAAALTKAAEEKIVHRDIKPENIMLSKSGEVKVADFGLARVIDGNTDLTQIGVTMGTPLYMSPEQVEGKPLDSRSDIYSLGVTTYQMLAGQPPFTGDNALGVAVKHLKQEAEPLSQARADLPTELCELVHRMLAKAPEDRFAGGGELLKALRNVPVTDANTGWLAEIETQGIAVAATTPQIVAATQQLQAVMAQDVKSPGARRNRWIFAALAAAIVLGATVGWQLRPGPLLAGPETLLKEIPKLENGWAQLYHAKVNESELAWQAVIDYYGDDEFFRRLAYQQLALHYLDRNQLDQAYHSFEVLANSGDQDLVAAFGNAGMAVVHALRGQTSRMEDRRVRVTADLQARLRDQFPQLAERFESVWRSPTATDGPSRPPIDGQPPAQ